MVCVQIISLFPEFFTSPVSVGILARALKKGLLKLSFVNPRDFTTDAYNSVDAPPFGGKEGMVMKFAPLKKALLSLPERGRVVFLTPQGQSWSFKKAREWGSACVHGNSPGDKEEKKTYTLICGRYSGVDERFIAGYVDEEISVGDYVLTGGEPAALVILDSVCRFLKGALGNESSPQSESFEGTGLLEAPQWTKPRQIKGYTVPSVLLSGHHKNIKNFKHLMSVLITFLKRPDLLQPAVKNKDLPKALKMFQTLSPSEVKACGITAEQLSRLRAEIP